MHKQIFSVTVILFTLIVNLYAQVVDPFLPDSNPPQQISNMKLSWNDEFNIDGKPNPANWKYETGFVRNEELQWYQSDNINCKHGVLVIDGKKEQVLNPNYMPGSADWKKKRQYASYTSGSITSQGLQQFQFGRFEIRARIDTTKGSWPAIWTKGINGLWPNCGEADIMEYYRINGIPTVLANIAWGSATSTFGNWNTKRTPLLVFLTNDPDWCKKFHVWRMDWTKYSISLYLDDQLMNFALLSSTANPPDIYPVHPYFQKHFFLLNLALGALGGVPSATTLNFKYEVDYIRVYQETEL